jgi:hypothetical protein
MIASDPRITLLLRQAEQAYHGRSWHGPALRASLRRVGLDVAAYRPQPERHNIWELVVHCAYWKYRVIRRVVPGSVTSFSLVGSDWFPRPETMSEDAWNQDVSLLDTWHARLVEIITALEPEHLDTPVGSSEFNVVDLVSGIVAHDLYHAGQIRLLHRMFDGRDPIDGRS